MIGLAVTKEEYEFLTQSTPNFNLFYLITNWSELDKVKKETTALLYSREWFISQGVDVVSNLIALDTHYRNASISSYYANLEFNQGDSTHLLELSSLLEQNFYNILIGKQYDFKSLTTILSHSMTRADWEVWISWLKETSITPQNTTGVSNIKTRRSTSLGVKKEGSSDKKRTIKKEQQAKAEEIKKTKVAKEKKVKTKATKQERVKPKKEIKQSINIDVQGIKQSIAHWWGVFKKLYLKGSLFIVAGVGVALIGFKPLIEMNVSNKGALSEWEEIKKQQSDAFIPTEKPVLEDDEESIKNNTQQATDLVGLITLPHKEQPIGVRIGISNAVLNKGAGIDEDTNTLLGTRGNTVIYGHREEVFWELKNIQKGDVILIDTLEGELKYEVKNTYVTVPEDEAIYKHTTKSVITLVTCHPFVYMGSTPERFVVEAELI